MVERLAKFARECTYIYRSDLGFNLFRQYQTWKWRKSAILFLAAASWETVWYKNNCLEQRTISEQSEEDDEDLMDEEDESGFSRFTANIHICQRVAR